MVKKRVNQNRCAYCGRFFRPDYRVGETQKSCQAERCKKMRKKESQCRWFEENPDYFRGRYEHTKRWRKNHPEYQRLWRARRREIQDEICLKTPVKTLRLVVPEKWFRGEIQDEIRLLRQCGCGFFVTGAGVRDTRRDCPT